MSSVGFATKTRFKSLASKHKQLNRALLDAVIMRDIKRVRDLLQQGADLHTRDKEHEETPVILAAKFADAAMVSMLLEAGAEVDTRDDQGRTALFFASVSSEVFQVLLAAGADIHALDQSGQTILMKKVSESASLAEVERLLKLGIDPTLLNEDGESALDIALSLGLVLVVERLKAAVAA